MPATASLSRLPLPKDRFQHLDLLTEGLDTASLWWLSGYTAGLARRVAPGPDVPMPVRAAAEPDAGARLTVVYGSQTGNAKRLAEQLAQQAETGGLAVRLLRADAYPQRELAQERLLYAVISTQGDGDAPDDARGLLDFLASRRAPKLDALSFAVLGLGDTSYPQFCVIGRKLDARLAELGGKRLFAFGEADLDLDTVAVPWAKQALGIARDVLKASGQPAEARVTPLRPHLEVAEAASWSATHPFTAEILAAQRITTADSAKDVRHIEVNLAESRLDYQPGDSLGVVERNPEPLVDALLETVHLDGTAAVSVGDVTRELREWLYAKREITRLNRPFVAALAERSGDAELKALLDPAQGEALRALLEASQPIDLLQRYGAEWTPEALVTALRPLVPRLYSIASSRAAVEDEAHLTVAHVEYPTPAGTRWGAASHWLATRGEGAQIEVYLERNERFRLPADGARDVIMIGPGTGVAPFRGFVQERAAAGATGRNWLFFGNPHFHTDFLYQLEWQAALKDGSLTRMDVAFSRDQAEKVYVQQRVRERGKELYAWLEGGAHLYVCGAISMARDAEAAVRDVLVTHGGRTPETADEYLNALREQHRYARDVY
ncbi:MAG: assimilatory sulfite reductase (NADPH) flavoprotein subunit [Rhodanobacter sp.]|nr:MAG: assimilatory sulfite reductase (NADPH) flavoprotein subunit [Rhodanobacter sp.]TAM13136.1 MAG: assimilatory sulfite reductase (NADPH) flavoprotein subunit [Rhodanobacter sp.]TAM35137.1 MAG: assimilatory sulfite reductase (NADPH) flavoprotein subunit [Rhodanobacter sp.]